MIKTSSIKIDRDIIKTIENNLKNKNDQFQGHIERLYARSSKIK